MIKEVLNSAALILSIVNGLMLLVFYLRDKPKLKAKPVYGDSEQWWFNLSDGVHDDKPTKRYGFLAKLSISNSGLRDVSATSWNLFIRKRNFTTQELLPQSIPEPIIRMENIKHEIVLPVLGIRGEMHSGETHIKSGASIYGAACYVYEFRGSDAWDLLVENEKIHAKIKVSDVFGKSSWCNITLSHKTKEEIEKIFPVLLKIE